jgi:membrane-associated phospholipid phosphatase
MVRAFMHRLPHRLAACYAGYRWVWHLVAVVLTAALVLSGADWWFFAHTRDILLSLVIIAGLGGFIMPFAVALGLYATGRKRAGVVFGQASFLGWFITSFYKVFTGRTQPEFITHAQAADYTHAFNFGLLKHGIFFGWPSSHAATAVAGAVALWLVWRNTAGRVAIVAWAAVVCAGAAIGFHWLSDVVAGVIIGAVAGYAVATDKK